MEYDAHEGLRFGFHEVSAHEHDHFRDSCFAFSAIPYLVACICLPTKCSGGLFPSSFCAFCVLFAPVLLW